MHRVRLACLTVPFFAVACGSFGTDNSTADAGSSSCDASAGPGCSAPMCSGSDCPTPVSCKTLHATRAELLDGLYTIDPDGAGPLAPVQMYCDMTTDGGGWTLVARSVEGESLTSDFGWVDDHGDADDDTGPFSFEVAPLGISFTEILCGARGPAKTWDAPVYKHVVPAEFVSTYRTTSFIPSGGASSVRGTCQPLSGPSMLSVIGFTKTGDHFAFTDNPNNVSFGLWSSGWDTNGAFGTPENMCSYTGELTGKQGMIFVR